MIDPNKPATAIQEQHEEVKHDQWLLQELQELLDDKEEYHW